MGFLRNVVRYIGSLVERHEPLTLDLDITGNPKVDYVFALVEEDDHFLGIPGDDGGYSLPGIKRSRSSHSVNLREALAEKLREFGILVDPDGMEEFLSTQWKLNGSSSVKRSFFTVPHGSYERANDAPMRIELGSIPKDGVYNDLKKIGEI